MEFITKFAVWSGGALKLLLTEMEFMLATVVPSSTVASCGIGCRSKIVISKLLVNPDKCSRFHLNPKRKGLAFHASTAGGK
jgi:hypothetical protein